MDDLIFWVVVMAIAGIAAIARAIRRQPAGGANGEEGREARPVQRPQRAQSATVDEMRRFLEEIRRQTEEALGRQTEPAPPMPPRPESGVRTVPSPTMRRPATRPRKPAPSGEEPVVLKEVAAPPPKPQSTAVLAAKRPALDVRARLVQRLPQDELKRAIVLREIVGPPRALTHSRIRRW